jgi:hypothetical protein
MNQLTPEAQNALQNLAQRYGVSVDAVTSMLFAVSNGGGTMAQFNVPELGGSGQWMQGGMTMVGDMFNYGLAVEGERPVLRAFQLASHAERLRAAGTAHVRHLAAAISGELELRIR